MGQSFMKVYGIKAGETPTVTSSCPPRGSHHHLTLGFEKEKCHHHTGLPAPSWEQTSSWILTHEEYPLQRKPSLQVHRDGLPCGPHQGTHTRMDTVRTPPTAARGTPSGLGCVESMPAPVQFVLRASAYSCPFLWHLIRIPSACWLLKSTHTILGLYCGFAVQYIANLYQAKKTLSFPSIPSHLVPGSEH